MGEQLWASVDWVKAESMWESRFPLQPVRLDKVSIENLEQEALSDFACSLFGNLQEIKQNVLNILQQQKNNSNKKKKLFLHIWEKEEKKVGPKLKGKSGREI